MTRWRMQSALEELGDPQRGSIRAINHERSAGLTSVAALVRHWRKRVCIFCRRYRQRRYFTTIQPQRCAPINGLRSDPLKAQVEFGVYDIRPREQRDVSAL